MVKDRLKEIETKLDNLIEMFERIELKLKDIDSKTLMPKLKDRIEVERW